MYFDNFSTDIIKNNETVNIFTDASMRPNGQVLDSCYGAVAVYEDSMIMEDYRLGSAITVPCAEGRGLRTGLQLAFNLSAQFRIINLFCDSQLTIFSIRDYMPYWVYDPVQNALINKMGNPVKNQSIYIECNAMIKALENTGHIVNLFHLKSHVDNGNKGIRHALEVFKKSNNIAGKVDYNSIRYISSYNNFVDNKTRSILNRSNTRETRYYDPISFYPIDSIFGPVDQINI